MEVMMRFAIPVQDGRLSRHFGHCERFVLIDFDSESGTGADGKEVKAPRHQPGLLPRWLAEQGVNVVIAAGMGPRAVTLLAEQGIQVIVGAQPETPDRLVAAYMAGELKVGENVCDH
jgi:ATP-binding protein involved in chromosome partitioning